MTAEDLARRQMPGHDSADELAEDCAVLLDHVTRLPDSRLDWCFEETRARIAGAPPARVAMPPAATPQKDAFLERLVRLGCRLRDPAGNPQPAPAEDIAFLIAARDFLSGLAWPATVQSIRITDEYNRTTGIARLAVAAWWLRARLSSEALQPPEAGHASPSRQFGRVLAFRVGCSQVLAVLLVAFTIGLSIYTLIGRGLLLQVQATEALFATLAADMDAAEQADAPVFLVLAGAGQEPRVTKPILSGPEIRRYCDYVEVREVAGRKEHRFATRQHQKLCDRYDGHNRALRQLYGRLQEWKDRAPAWLFPATHSPEPLEPAARMVASSDRIAVAGLPNGAEDSGQPVELHVLQQLRLEVASAQVVLQAIAEYLLPCLYAMLGALAAALRHIARRAEEATLDFSDGGLISRTLVLGVLFGAVIGLFASQIGAGAAAGGEAAIASLTPAAVSLLAGYSVARVFEFLDVLSLRVFGPRSGPAAPAA